MLFHRCCRIIIHCGECVSLQWVSVVFTCLYTNKFVVKVISDCDSCQLALFLFNFFCEREHSKHLFGLLLSKLYWCCCRASITCCCVRFVGAHFRMISIVFVVIERFWFYNNWFGKVSSWVSTTTFTFLLSRLLTKPITLDVLTTGLAVIS